MVELNEVPQIVNTTLRDIPGRLRELAKAIEDGERGLVETCAIVLVREGADGCQNISVMGYGDRSEHDTIGVVLLAGANMIADNYR